MKKQNERENGTKRYPHINYLLDHKEKKERYRERERDRDRDRERKIMTKE